MKLGEKKEKKYLRGIQVVIIQDKDNENKCLILKMISRGSSAELGLKSYNIETLIF